MHTHQSLWRGGEPLFFSETGYAGISDMARWYIGGLLAHAKSVLAFAAPTTNSYKRLVPGYEAPVNLVYSQRNRSASVRIPLYSKSPKAKRLEFRCPDPSCNPYLAFAAMLHAGLDGIRQKLPLPPPVEENLYAFDPERLARQQQGQLPSSLADALRALRQDEVMREALGVHLLERFIEAKEIEWQSYEKQVSAWELDAYLETY
jgi:glutamine synthetase